MDSFAPLILLLGAPLVLYLRYRLRKSRPSDGQAIDDLIEARQLRKVAVTRDDSYWTYWIRGRLFSLSNCARIYIVVGEELDGLRREIHVAFDDWPPHGGKLQVLLEREMPSHKGKAGLEEPAA